MKISFLTLLAMLTGISLASAQMTGGFQGPRAPSMEPMTIKQALSMSDDTIVVLNGKIVNSLGDEKYTFQDATGEVIVEIDDEDWFGKTVTPENTIEIIGEVDKEFMKPTKIDVKSFTVK